MLSKAKQIQMLSKADCTAKYSRCVKYAYSKAKQMHLAYVSAKERVCWLILT